MIDRIVIKYKKIPLPVKASFWFIISSCIQKGIQIITTPIYTRLLSANQYGEYSVFLSWIEILAVFATLDIFYSGYNVGMNKFLGDRERYTASMHGLCSTITTVLFLIFLIWPNIWCNTLGMSRELIMLLFVYMYIMPAFQFWSAKQRFEYKYIALIIITTIISVGTILLGIIFAMNFSEKGVAVILAKVVGEGIIAIPLYIYSVKRIGLLFNKYYWKYALKFNIPLIPHYLSTMILNHSDKIMIQVLVGQSYAAIYSVAYSISVLMTIIQTAINNAFIPWLFKKLKKEEYKEISSIANGIIILVGILNLFLVAFAPEIIYVMAPSEYQSAIWVIPPVAMGIFLTSVYGMFVNVEFYYESNKLTAIASFMAAVINIVLNYIFIKRFGFIVAGYTTFLCYLLLAIFHYCAMKYICKKEIGDIKIYNIKQIILIISIIIGIAIILQIMYKETFIRYGFVLVILMIIVIRKDIIFNILLEMKKK